MSELLDCPERGTSGQAPPGLCLDLLLVLVARPTVAVAAAGRQGPTYTLLLQGLQYFRSPAHRGPTPAFRCFVPVWQAV